MTRKNYVAIADALREGFGNTADPAVVWAVSDRIADVFAADNARFDRARFIAAVQGR